MSRHPQGRSGNDSFVSPMWSFDYETRTRPTKTPCGRPLPKLRFKQSEIERAIRGLRNQGLGVSRIEIDPASGRFTIVSGQPSNSANDTSKNPWDTVLTNEPR